MNKAELVGAVCDRTGANRAVVEGILGELIEVIQDTVAAGSQVKLTGFGTWKPVERAARVGRNPKTGEEMPIAARRVPQFSPGQVFKQKVGGNG